MIVFYDVNGNPVPLDDYEDYSITHKLDGCDVMTFSLNMHHDLYPLLYEEARVVAGGNEWLIKKIDDDKVDCELNFDFLKGTIYQSYKSSTRSLQEVLESHLPKVWTILGAGVTSTRRTIEFDFCTDYDVVYQCMNTYKVYFMWDIPNKRLTVVSQTAMQSTGEYLTSELNLKSLSFKGNTTEFATRLYAYGKDGMTMEEAVVDGERYGLTYVENKSYVDKVVCAYWSDERYTLPDSLYEDALDKLSSLSMPVRSYECSVIDLAKQSDEYSFLDFKMHKKVTLIDIDRSIRVEHQIVEYKEYPDEPDRNKVTLSCVPDTITTSIKNAVSTFAETTEKMQTGYDERIAMATAMLTGAFGSHVFSNGSEIFLMDAEDPAAAKVVWRWNSNGFGKSSTGIDGPYTTALTFDDEFITGVINAMVIRGSLIEADSVQASAISQSYTDSVLKQSFTAAEGLVEALFQQISTYLSNSDETGELDVIKSTITSIQETIEGLVVSVKGAYSGGINYVKNSSGLNGVSTDWEVSGTVITQQNNDTKNSTVANSCFRLSENASLSQAVENIIAGTDYTISVKVKKTTSYFASITVTYNGSTTSNIFSSTSTNGWQEYSLTLHNVQSSTIEITAATSGSHLYFADLMVCEGNVAKSWTPAPYEIYTTYTKIDENGVHVWRTDSEEHTAMTNTEFAGYYDEEEMFSLNKDETRMTKAVIRGDLVVGDAKFIPYKNGAESGLNITLID